MLAIVRLGPGSKSGVYVLDVGRSYLEHLHELCHVDDVNYITSLPEGKGGLVDTNMSPILSYFRLKAVTLHRLLSHTARLDNRHLKSIHTHLLHTHINEGRIFTIKKIIKKIKNVKEESAKLFYQMCAKTEIKLKIKKLTSQLCSAMSSDDGGCDR